jgi:hypothetical protein
LPALAILLFTAVGVRAGAPEWQDFVWRKGECVILMPAKPQQLTRTIPGPNGSTLEVYMQFVDLKSVAYVLSYVDNPTFKGAGSQQLEEVLNKARDGAVGKGKLIKETKLKHGPYPGREVLVELSASVSSRSRLFVVEEKLYQLVILGSREACTAKEADEFLASFKLLK